jgi:hypothetical protein
MTEDLQYRLYNLSIDPPTNAWPGIALQLDKETEQSLSLKLQQAALEPPPAVWDKIANALNEPAQARVIPIKRTWTRIAVAALIAGVIVLAGLFYIMQSESSNSTANKNKQAPTPAITNTQTEKEDIQVEMPEPRATLGYAAAGAFNPIRIRKRADTRIRYARVEMQPGAGESEVSVDGLAQPPLSGQPNAHIEPKEYLTIAAPNGQPAKISARFTDGLGYLYNYQAVHSIDGALKSLSWKRRFSNWSNKLMANNGFIPASNFLDIVDLEALLKE